MAKKPGEALIDLSLRAWLFFSNILIGGYVLPQWSWILSGLPVNIYALAQIISVQLLPLSAFPKLETAATWLLWIFIGLMFAGAGWKQMLLMLAIGGVAMGFLSSLGVFAVADSEIAASYNDLVQNTKVKNNTAGAVSNVWLMLSNPRLWYETQYGYKNETLAQGDQTSPFALEITKAEVLEKVAPPGGDATFDVQLKNKGLRTATLKSVKIEVGALNGVGKMVNESLGDYDRYIKDSLKPCVVGGLVGEQTTECLRKDDPEGSYLYFESTPDAEAHYSFCDNPTTGGSVSINPAAFEPGVIDEGFGSFKSPSCYGRHKVTAKVTYGYNVTGTYNLELINKEYFTELAKYNKLKFHNEDSRSTEGPMKLTIRSVPEEQPVRVDENLTVFYSLSNIGPGTAVIKGINDIYLEGIDGALSIYTDKSGNPMDCSFKTGACPAGVDGPSCAFLDAGAIKNFYVDNQDKLGEQKCGLTFGKEGTAIAGEKTPDLERLCIKFSSEDATSVVLLKCKFKYDTSKGQIDTTKTLFMKMHVNYDYMTSRTSQYETTAMPGFHSCVTKRALDGFPNKTAMDLYLREVFKEVPAEKMPKWSSTGFDSGSKTGRTDFCIK